MFLEGLEEQVRLARGDDGVFRVVHEQHRRTGDWGGDEAGIIIKISSYARCRDARP